VETQNPSQAQQAHVFLTGIGLAFIPGAALIIANHGSAGRKRRRETTG
jgi:hypothetical protein